MPVGIWAGQMSTYQRVMKYICTHTHACTHAYMHTWLAHVWPYIVELISSTGKHPLAAAFCRAPAWYMNYADARAQEECVCVCWGVCGSMEYVCVWLCLIYYILAFWQIAKRSSRFRTNFRVQLLFRHRCRCRCHSPSLTFSLSLSLSLSSSCPSSSLSSVALKAKSKLLITSTVSGAAFYICHVQGF